MTDRTTVLLTVRQVAERLVLDPKTVYELVWSRSWSPRGSAQPAAPSACPKLSSPATSNATSRPLSLPGDTSRSGQNGRRVARGVSAADGGGGRGRSSAVAMSPRSP